jgi:hypothetical protein
MWRGWMSFASNYWISNIIRADAMVWYDHN